VAIFHRGLPERSEVTEPVVRLDEEAARLRDETDIDPLVEDATARLRESLTQLEARDEWGRTIPWRHVARIVLGPLLTQLRDSETAFRLLQAHGDLPPAPEASPEVAVEITPEPTGWPGWS
jgi:hypothetical protein